MGRSIAVKTHVTGDLATLVSDRPLTGEDGEAFASPGDALTAGTPASVLAERLFNGDSAINHVFAHSNVVEVKRDGGWDATSLTEVTHALKVLLASPDALGANNSMPIGGEGLGLTVAEPSRTAVTDVALDPAHIESLRAASYNATITSIRRVHDSLWIIDVTPDGEFPNYQAGQYATLGLGFWEPRIDGRHEEFAEGQIEKLARRSYSISSSILDAEHELLDPTAEVSLEFYVVLVETDWQATPAILTPRLFGKGVGDRIYLGRKIAGRYRLDKLTGNHNDVAFLATGTGEAPHNRMVLDLLSDGHRGQIVSVCTSRYLRDLAYLDTHNKLMEQYDNYRDFPMTTREQEN